MKQMLFDVEDHCRINVQIWSESGCLYGCVDGDFSPFSTKLLLVLISMVLDPQNVSNAPLMSSAVLPKRIWHLLFSVFKMVTGL